MKNILFLIIMILVFGFSACAQDGFFRGGSYDEGDGRLATGTVMPGLPRGDGVGASDNDHTAPLGSGLLILTALGGSYLLRKKE